MCVCKREGEGKCFAHSTLAKASVCLAVLLILSLQRHESLAFLPLKPTCRLNTGHCEAGAAPHVFILKKPSHSDYCAFTC